MKNRGHVLLLLAAKLAAAYFNHGAAAFERLLSVSGVSVGRHTHKIARSLDEVWSSVQRFHRNRKNNLGKRRLRVTKIEKGIEDSASGTKAQKNASKERARTKGRCDVRARSVRYQ